MPQQKPWAAKANASDEEVVAYKGLTKEHLTALEAQGVDVAPYVAAQLANKQLELDNAPATRERVRKTFAHEKRKLLQALATRAATKVGKGLKAAQASHAVALQENKDQADDLAVAQAAQAAAPAALQQAQPKTSCSMQHCSSTVRSCKTCPRTSASS